MGVFARVALCVAVGATVMWAQRESAWPHDQWADGSPVPPWVKAACCGPQDIHHLRDDQVHLTADGYKVDGYPDVIPASKALPSPDGDYWIFYKVSDTASGPSYSPVYCFFTKFSGT